MSGTVNLVQILRIKRTMGSSRETPNVVLLNGYDMLLRLPSEGLFMAIAS